MPTNLVFYGDGTHAKDAIAMHLRELNVDLGFTETILEIPGVKPSDFEVGITDSYLALMKRGIPFTPQDLEWLFKFRKVEPGQAMGRDGGENVMKVVKDLKELEISWVSNIPKLVPTLRDKLEAHNDYWARQLYSQGNFLAEDGLVAKDEVKVFLEGKTEDPLIREWIIASALQDEETERNFTAHLGKPRRAYGPTRDAEHMVREKAFLERADYYLNIFAKGCQLDKVLNPDVVLIPRKKLKNPQQPLELF